MLLTRIANHVEIFFLDLSQMLFRGGLNNDAESSQPVANQNLFRLVKYDIIHQETCSRVAAMSIK